MEVRFETMSGDHRKYVIDIFNYYVSNSLAACPDFEVPYEHYDRFLDMTKGYPAYVLKCEEKVIGFSFLRPHNNQAPEFNESAEIISYIDKDYIGKGLGKMILAKLETDAKNMGIKNILAGVCSETPEVLSFHVKNGFKECGLFKKIGFKKGRYYDVVWMHKELG